MNNKQTQEQKELLKNGTGWGCIKFAREVMGADIQALQARVLEIGTFRDCMRLAIYVIGADKDALFKRAEELEKKELTINKED